MHADRLATIRDTWQRFGTMIDTHTADGLKVAREHKRDGVPMLVLETALPAKFAETIREALGIDAAAPGGAAGHRTAAQALSGACRSDAERVKRYIREHTA